MKKYRQFITLLFCGVLLCTLFACQQEKKPVLSEWVQAEMKRLQTNQDKKRYLERVGQSNNMFRGNELTKIIIKHGEDSDAHKAFLENQEKLVKENVERMEAYVATFGYPKKEDVGKLAIGTPITIINYSEDYDIKKKYFPYFYEAYTNREIDEDVMFLYLDRMHKMRTGEKLNLDKPTPAKEKIKLLITRLHLDSTKKGRK